MLHYLFDLVKFTGSSFLLPAHGSGGARATIILKAPQKNRAKPEKQKGKKEGGLGEGIFALLRLEIERFRFSLIKRNIRQYGGQAPQINVLFLLPARRSLGAGGKEKNAREKIKKCRENLSVLVPPKWSGGGRKRTSLFWILFKESSNIVQKTPLGEIWQTHKKLIYQSICKELSTNATNETIIAIKRNNRERPN